VASGADTPVARLRVKVALMRDGKVIGRDTSRSTVSIGGQRSYVTKTFRANVMPSSSASWRSGLCRRPGDRPDRDRQHRFQG